MSNGDIEVFEHATYPATTRATDSEQAFFVLSHSNHTSPYHPPTIMPTIPAPSVDSNREEWPDAEVDIPEGQPLHSITDKDDEEEDWDLEMDLGKTGSARIRAPSASIVSDLIPSTMTGVITIRPPTAFYAAF
ncbi:hypothetical protein E1B28_013840 [Marasmius oreades]|uniref:Uncharacterized protein n=1 Tax=Marasmius oreades TaxID=181124 RepID=A0A9P7RLC1_9AGAR|nr:uncharacterized protein E1B28_013840 [Marasmius oreades]KAG7085300.1 hypothetical protein E1B28_013840 [Marasmius oreades]